MSGLQQAAQLFLPFIAVIAGLALVRRQGQRRGQGPQSAAPMTPTEPPMSGGPSIQGGLLGGAAILGVGFYFWNRFGRYLPETRPVFGLGLLVGLVLAGLTLGVIARRGRLDELTWMYDRMKTPRTMIAGLILIGIINFAGMNVPNVVGGLIGFIIGITIATMVAWPFAVADFRTKGRRPVSAPAPDIPAQVALIKRYRWAPAAIILGVFIVTLAARNSQMRDMATPRLASTPAPGPICPSLLEQIASDDPVLAWRHPSDPGISFDSLLIEGVADPHEGPEALASLANIGPNFPTEFARASSGGVPNQAQIVIVEYASEAKADEMVRWVVTKTCKDAQRAGETYASDSPGRHIRMAQFGNRVFIAVGREPWDADSLLIAFA